MAHIRKLIRDNIKTTLTGLTTTGANCFASRVYPIESARLPGIIIYTESEANNYVTIGLPRTQRRTLRVSVEVYVNGVSNYDATLDLICAEIEDALYTDLTRGGYAEDTKVINFDSQFSGDGNQPVAIGVLTVEVEYHSTEGSINS
jgi:hypothetical protein